MIGPSHFMGPRPIIRVSGPKALRTDCCILFFSTEGIYVSEKSIFLFTTARQRRQEEKSCLSRVIIGWSKTSTSLNAIGSSMGGVVEFRTLPGSEWVTGWCSFYPGHVGMTGGLSGHVEPCAWDQS